MQIYTKYMTVIYILVYKDIKMVLSPAQVCQKFKFFYLFGRK